MNFSDLSVKIKNNFYATNFILQIIRLELIFTSLIFFSNCIFPQISSVWGYLAGILFAKLCLNKGVFKPFLKAFYFCLVCLLLGNVSSFFYLFLSQTDLYTIYEYFDGASTPYIIIFSLILGGALSFIAIYSTIPSKKKKTDTVYTDFS